MNGRTLLGLTVATLAISACHSRTSSGGLNGLTPVSSLHPPLPVMAFSGRFTPVRRTASGDNLDPGSIRITGIVHVTSQPGSDYRFVVETDFTTQRGAEELLWSIVEGSCGTDALPLVSPRNLQPVFVGSDGRATMNTDFLATLSADKDYHLNLYANGGTNLADVIGCANLRKG